MSQLYAQLASRPNPWILGRTSAGLCTLQTACPLTVTYSGGTPAADTIAAGSAATVYGGSAAAFDASVDVWVVLTAPGSGALQVVKEADLATVTGDWSGLARIAQHSMEPYQPQASLGVGGPGNQQAQTLVPLVSDTTAKALSLWNGSSNNTPPTNWQTSGFSDSGWSPAVLSYDENPSGITYIAGTHIIWPENPGIPVSVGQEQALFRHHVTLPAGTLTGATLTLVADIILEALYINGTSVGTWPHTFPSLPATDTQTYTVPAGTLAAGAGNVVAVWVSNDNSPGDPSGGLAYKLTVTYAGAGNVLPDPGGSEGDILYYHNGQWVTLAPSTNGYELTLVGGDPAWTAQPADSDYSDPLTTKGDLLTRSASATVRLGVGSNGQVPTADSTAADGITWATPAAGSVTSIDVAVPAPLSASGGPITASGTITLAWASGQTANRVLASPNGSSGAVSLRALVGNDIPVDASTLISAAGVIKGNYQAGSGVSISGNTISATGSGGSVTSVALSMPGIFSVSGSPITTAGTLSATLASQAKATVFAGPASGSSAAPTFRALQGSDLPAAASAGGHIHAHGHFL